MKLVQILARELKDWPEHEEYGKILYITQGGNSAIMAWEYEGLSFSVNSWVSTMGLPTEQILYGSEMAVDHATAIVTRADWEAERARIAEKAAELHMRQEREKLVKPKPAKKASAEGWVRHRGGKCPVGKGVFIDVRHRDGQIIENVPALLSAWAGEAQWAHDTPHKAPGEIMAYRIHKPDEQPVIEPAVAANVQAFNEQAELRECIAKAVDGPLQWRDRIREIDRTVEALEEERVALVQRLEGEGFALIERAVQPVDDMSDWRNWRDGDEVLCIKSHHKTFITEGAVYRILGLSEVEEPESIGFLDDDGDIMEYKACNFKFHSRPSK